MQHNLNSNLLIENSFQHPLFNDYPDPVFTLDLKGNFLSTNKALIDLAECTKEELFKSSFVPFILPGDLEMVSGYFQKTIIGKIQNFDTQVISAKGNLRSFNITNLPIVINNEVIGVHVIAKDITERKNSEQQLKLEQKKYRDLFNFSPIPQWVYDLETLRFLDVNNAAVKHYCYTREEFLEMTIKDIRPAADIESLEANLDQDIKPGVSNQNLVRHLKKNGTLMHVCIEGNSIFFDGKNARLVLAIDYTEKIKSERALAASEKRFKALVQDGSDLVAILDLAGNYRYVSPTSKTILGIEADDYIGKNAFDFIHIDDQENFLQYFSLLEEQKRIKIPPYRFKIGEENYRWIETIVTNMMDDPTVAGIVANSRDVTQRIENEIKTEESIERFNTVSKATNEAIWDWNIQTGNMIWNRGIKGIFGYNQISYNRDWWYSRVHIEDVDGIVAKIQSLIKRKKSRLKVEYRFRSANGTYKYVLDRSFLLFDKTGNPLKMIGSMQDITDNVNYIEAIEKQNQRLREIAFTQSHHVRAPLARIIGLSKLLSDNDEKEEIKKEYLQYLVSSADELDTVIKDIVKKAENL